MATLRFPTGSTESLRGLGVTRTMLSFIASGGQGRFRPHANAGYEYWSNGVSVASDAVAGTNVTARNQVQYAAGFEFEAAPKATLLLDVVGGQVFGGGKLAFQARRDARRRRLVLLVARRVAGRHPTSLPGARPQGESQG